MTMETDVKNSRYYLNRELSWLQFNKRVLQEAVDTSNPLLEKLKFLAITNESYKNLSTEVIHSWKNYDF